MDTREEMGIERMEEYNADVQVEVIRDGTNIISDEMSSDNDSVDERNDDELFTQADMLCENEDEHEDHKSIEDNTTDNDLNINNDEDINEDIVRWVE